jgi:hypothetical protein
MFLLPICVPSVFHPWLPFAFPASRLVVYFVANPSLSHATPAADRYFSLVP